MLVIYPRRELDNLPLEVQSAHELAEDGAVYLTTTRQPPRTTHLSHATVDMKGFVDQIQIQWVMGTNHAIVMKNLKMKIRFKT